jgi:predicted small lipoprotein YifL
MNQPTQKSAMRKIIISKYLIAMVVAPLAACSVTPPYPLKPDEKVATLKIIAAPEATMCRNSEYYKITTPQGKTEARIPSGERVSLGTFMQYSGYNVSYSCYPFVSFIPKEGEKYVLHNFVKGDKCYVEIVGLDGATSTGVKFEESIAPRHCYKEK